MALRAVFWWCGSLCRPAAFQKEKGGKNGEGHGEKNCGGDFGLCYEASRYTVYHRRIPAKDSHAGDYIEGI